MKFHLFSALSLSAAALAGASTALRGNSNQNNIDINNVNDNDNDNDNDRSLRAAMTGFYNETLGQCTGAVCAVYGDPHIMTCDGFPYDCQAEGVFTIMENHMFKVQGNFMGMAVEDRLAWIRDIGGSLLNDVMIEFKNNSNVPILQLGFGDVTEAIEEFPSHVGCTKKKYYAPRKKYRNKCGTGDEADAIVNNCHTDGPTHGDTDVYKCRERCERTEGCAKFNFWYDQKCEMYYEDAPLEPQPGSWNLNLAGTLESECGVKQPMPEYKAEAERHFHGAIGGNKNQKCPLLMHLDGELQDISFYNGQQKGYLVGDAESDFSVRLYMSDVHVTYTTDRKSKATFKLIQSGAGPGEKWNCHWHMINCLPGSHEEEFIHGGLGLLGTPNGNIEDDWMLTNGTTIPLIKGENHQAEFDYCDSNWCVEQEDSIMAFPGDWTWDDVKCSHKEYKEVDINDPECDLSADHIIDACAHVPAMLRYACELDCCYGGCTKGDQEIIDEILELKKMEKDEDNEEGSSSDEEGGPDHDQCHPGEGFLNTGDTVCPGAAPGTIVKVLQQEGSDGSGSLPGANDILYGLALNIEPNERVDGKNLRFLVNNPFGSTADIYVQHDRNVLDNMMEPACFPMIDTDTGCDKQAPKIEVACRDFHNGSSYALVHVYFSSKSFPATDGVAVDKCCLPEDSSSDSSSSSEHGVAGVVKYTFSIQCGCPDDSALGR